MKDKSFIITMVFLNLLIVHLVSCEKSEKPFEPPPQPPVQDTITINVESVSHRSVSLNLNKKLSNKDDTYQLTRVLGDNVEIAFSNSIISLDTIIVDDNYGEGLELNTNYNYKVYRFDSLGVRRDSSNTVNEKTQSVTSHDYSWERITIGEWQSWLSDVWGTNEYNVYATGRIVLNGETNGLLHYDGNSWNASSGVGGSAIFGFSEDDVWIVGGAVFHFDGSTWTQIDSYSSNGQSIPLDQVLFENLPYTGLWGTSSTNLYFTGLEGKIVHWDGNRGTRLDSPTDIDLTDIFGLSENFILATGAGSTYPSTAMISNGFIWKVFDNLPYDSEFYRSIFPVSRNEYYLGGNVSRKYFGGRWENLTIGGEGMIRKIRGDHYLGDIVAVGGVSALYHYNGEDWYNYSPEFQDESTILHGVYVTNGNIYTVGTDGTYAKIFIGRRD
jgi:hypothetical protein